MTLEGALAPWAEGGLHLKALPYSSWCRVAARVREISSRPPQLAKEEVRLHHVCVFSFVSHWAPLDRPEMLSNYYCSRPTGLYPVSPWLTLGLFL